ncbi:MAG: GxxExxY protein [Pseudoxanthomonas sp.]
MDTDQALLFDADLTDRVIGVFYAVYNELGWGFVESVYENALAMALRQIGLHIQQQACLIVSFRNQIVGEFRIDLLVENRLVVELKAVAQLAPAHEVQLLNYLKASGLHIGLLLNFGQKPQLKRKIFGLPKLDPPSSDLIRV